MSSIFIAYSLEPVAVVPDLSKTTYAVWSVPGLGMPDNNVSCANCDRGSITIGVACPNCGYVNQ